MYEWLTPGWILSAVCTMLFIGAAVTILVGVPTLAVGHAVSQIRKWLRKAPAK